MKTALSTVALLALSASAGCTFYFGGDGDDDCAVPPVYEGSYRNPETGACEPGGGGWDYGCGDDDDDYYGGPEPYPVEDAAAPDMAVCYERCEGLSEDACITTDGCRATYQQDAFDCPPGALCPEALPVFSECWGIAPSGPVYGACEGLDAWECSRHDDCIAVYLSGERFGFSYCAPEPGGGGGGGGGGCYSDEQCDAGWTCTASTECLPPPDCDPAGVCPDVCYGRCVPPDGSRCDLIDCAPGYTCVEACTSCPAPSDEPCVETCTAECVPVDPPPPPPFPGFCVGEVACDALPPACPDATVPGILDGCWTGFCIPREACSPGDPGACFGEALCERVPPACPDGTTPGIVDNCYSGYCIPLSSCGPLPL
jgi:hypothetical protein